MTGTPRIQPSLSEGPESDHAHPLRLAAKGQETGPEMNGWVWSVFGLPPIGGDLGQLGPAESRPRLPPKP